MKVLWVGLLFCSLAGRAQGVLETMLAQVSALEAGVRVTEKGYALVESGLNGIAVIKGDEYAQHRSYFSSLWQVSGAVGGSSVVQDALGLGMQITAVCRVGEERCHTAVWLGGEEKEYVGSLYAQIVGVTAACMDRLSGLLTADRLGMGDGERMKRLVAVRDELAAYLSAVMRMGVQVDGLCLAREKAAGGVGAVGRWYGVR